MARRKTQESTEETVADPADAGLDIVDEVSEPPSEESAPVIRYVGLADSRIIGSHEWNSQNGFAILASSVDAPLLEYLRSQPDFRVQ